MAKILMIIAPERFRDEELFVTKAELEEAGHETVIVSSVKGLCPGSRGGFATAILTLAEVQTEDYDAVVFVGGGGAKHYFANEEALRIAKEMDKDRKVVAAICLAPVILANAGILKGKEATVAGTEAKTLERQGARYTGPGVTVDGNLVTGNAPKQSKLFGQKINELLHARQ
ncbi:MAG: DJ-1/PfpI family protein [Caldilineaceae bacterium]